MAINYCATISTHFSPFYDDFPHEIQETVQICFLPQLSQLEDFIMLLQVVSLYFIIKITNLVESFGCIFECFSEAIYFVNLEAVNTYSSSSSNSKVVVK